MALAVLLVIVAALTQAVVAGQMHVFEAIHEVRAASLAEAMMEEILSRPYRDPDGASTEGPEPGEDERGDFDNADDFEGFTESPGAVADFAGNLYPPPYQGFSRSVSAVYTKHNLLGVERAGLLVTVTVADARGRTWTIHRFVPEDTE